jgi:hypothetical protein
VAYSELYLLQGFLSHVSLYLLWRHHRHRYRLPNSDKRHKREEKSVRETGRRERGERERERMFDLISRSVLLEIVVGFIKSSLP